jgi:hypothetical protein
MNDQSLELKQEEGEWSWLKSHLERGAIFVVSPKLKLLEAGRAVSTDSAPQVQAWIKEGLITRPTPEQLQKWDSAPHTVFSFMIVQPYVLIQEIVYN